MTVDEIDAGSITIGGIEIGAGERRTIELPVGRLPTGAELTMPVHVVCGRRPGPRLFVSAAIHGDEINGVEIVSRVLRMRQLDRLRGTLIAVPVVNVYGFMAYSRYLPDRRDLNRCFPGSDRGSLAARLAFLFMNEIVAKATHGIDLHTGTQHRTNLPHVRVTAHDRAALEMGRTFGTPIVKSEARDGSLREAAAERGVPMVVFEGGEALRFDEWAIRAGLRGALATMHHLEMLPTRRAERRPDPKPLVGAATRWVRAPEAGVLRTRVGLGARVRGGDVLGEIGEPYGREPHFVRATAAGIVIGHTQLPVVNEGDALFHLLGLDGARIEEADGLDAAQADLARAPVDPEPTA